MFRFTDCSEQYQSIPDKLFEVDSIRKFVTFHLLVLF